mmetsp:Transcript_22727/g.33560  ORF Transcript_22727/g.33560 Transcript_22727/m.33560 type:complete len:235 (+) Transcript_22727:116-820(+)|eukprot:CAMPEP_0194258178 /NCGR_PEP_ID=MMETSP0158-20130606/40726_1 /TAXON_ID=33649 /ORGANISM="Thalassionema nitzschioides, Strain L26-B" /LENGTH=234 /DNA_ID=CAMNT_0038997491 /DNA_START=112 /DNA_END=816 /DNA_ORIENTATION=-
MADDDLDAFFNEVAAVETEVKKRKEDGEDTIKPPPPKKLKRPLGVVVAASSSKVVVPKHQEELNKDFNPMLQTQEEQLQSVHPSATTILPQPIAPEPTHLQTTDSEKKKAHLRSAAGKVWKDQTLSDWPENDYRLFVGNLTKDVTDPELYEHFTKYPSLQMVKIVRDPKGISKGYGFVSLMEPMECAKAIREMDQSWLSSRPIKVRRSDWKDRELKNVKKKKRQQHRKLNRSLH